MNEYIQEVFRFLVCLFVALVMINFGYLVYNVNQVHNFQTAMSQQVAKYGNVTQDVKNQAKKMSVNRYYSMFSIDPVDKKGNTIPVKDAKPVDFGNPIKYKITMHIRSIAIMPRSFGIDRVLMGQVSSQLGQQTYEK